jgi:hypothetical protein
VPSKIRQLLENGKKLSNREFNDFVKIIIQKLNKTSFVIPKHMIVKVAKNIADKYPKTFIEFNGDKKISNLPVRFIAKLIGRRNYMRSEELKRICGNLKVENKN